MLHSIITTNIVQIKNLLFTHKVKSAYAFGSVCSEEFNDQSDIDLLIAFQDGLDPIEYGDHYFALVARLENLFQRDVDLVTEPSVRNPYLIASINKIKTAIYE